MSAIACGLLAAALPIGLAPASAAAKGGAHRGRCFKGGPKCWIWNGKVVGINDGDTVDVRVKGGKRETIRFLNVQALELTNHSPHPSQRRGLCNALAAATFVDHAVHRSHRRVRLSATHPRSDSQGRWMRSIAVRRHGHWKDLGLMEMKAGVTLWKTALHETAWNLRYNKAGQRAALHHRGIWDTSNCGPGPERQARLRVWPMSNPLGPDTVHNEYIKVQNLSPTRTVHLGAWWVRDAGLSHRQYKFPHGTKLRPGQSLTVHEDSGHNHGNAFYWGLPHVIFENTTNTGHVGNGAYLFDPKGNLRTWLVYPCVVHCVVPHPGELQVKAYERADPEYVVVHNRSTEPIDLYGYELRVPGGYAFPQGTVLQPGENLRVDVQGSPRSDAPQVLQMGLKGLDLPNGGGAVHLSTFDEISMACDSWGNGSC